MRWMLKPGRRKRELRKYSSTQVLKSTHAGLALVTLAAVLASNIPAGLALVLALAFGILPFALLSFPERVDFHVVAAAALETC